MLIRVDHLPDEAMAAREAVLGARGKAYSSTDFVHRASRSLINVPISSADVEMYISVQRVC